MSKNPNANAMIGLAYELVGFFAAPPLLGYFLDTRVFEFTGGRPGLFVFLGLFLGFAGGGWYLFRRLNSMNQAQSAERQDPQVIYKEESVENKVDRISRELDDVGRRIDDAARKSESREEDRK